jgi:hypothetical protein
MVEHERLMIIQKIKPVPSFLQNPLQGWERKRTWSCCPGRTNPWCQNTKDTTNQKSKLKDHWPYIFVQRSTTCKLDREDLYRNDLALRHPSLSTNAKVSYKHQCKWKWAHMCQQSQLLPDLSQPGPIDVIWSHRRTYASISGPTCVIRVNFSPILVKLDPQMPLDPTCIDASVSGPTCVIRVNFCGDISQHRTHRCHWAHLHQC